MRVPETVTSCPACHESWVFGGDGIISAAHLSEFFQDLDDLLLEHLAMNSRCWLVVGKRIHQDEFEMTEETL